MGRARGEITFLGATALVIGGGSPELASRVATITRSPWPFLADATEDRSVLHAFGFDRGPLGIQQSGTMVVDAAGTITYRQVGSLPHQALDLAAILAELRRLSAEGPAATPPPARA